MVKCTVCRSPDSALINKALLADKRSLRDVSQAFPSVSFAALSRHSKNCLNRTFDEGTKAPKPHRRVGPITKPEPSRITSADTSPKARLEAMIADVEDVITRAKDSGDARLVVLASRELRPCVDLLTKIERNPEAEDGANRQKFFEVMARLPDWFLAELAADDNAIGAQRIEKAIASNDGPGNDGNGV
jgi:hypothetical protein